MHLSIINHQFAFKPTSLCVFCKFSLISVVNSREFRTQQNYIVFLHLCSHMYARTNGWLLCFKHLLLQLSLKMEGSSVSSSSTVHSSENPSLAITRISSGREQFFSCQSFDDQFLECRDKSQQTVNTNNHSLQVSYLHGHLLTIMLFKSQSQIAIECSN